MVDEEKGIDEANGPYSTSRTLIYMREIFNRTRCPENIVPIPPLVLNKQLEDILRCCQQDPATELALIHLVIPSPLKTEDPMNPGHIVRHSVAVMVDFRPPHTKLYYQDPYGLPMGAEVEQFFTAVLGSYETITIGFPQQKKGELHCAPWTIHNLWCLAGGAKMDGVPDLDAMDTSIATVRAWQVEAMKPYNDSRPKERLTGLGRKPAAAPKPAPEMDR